MFNIWCKRLKCCELCIIFSVKITFPVLFFEYVDLISVKTIGLFCFVYGIIVKNVIIIWCLSNEDFRWSVNSHETLKKHIIQQPQCPRFLLWFIMCFVELSNASRYMYQIISLFLPHFPRRYNNSEKKLGVTPPSHRRFEYNFDISYRTLLLNKILLAELAAEDDHIWSFRFNNKNHSSRFQRILYHRQIDNSA